jgi:hypothetical protein
MLDDDPVAILQAEPKRPEWHRSKQPPNFDLQALGSHRLASFKNVYQELRPRSQLYLPVSNAKTAGTRKAARGHPLPFSSERSASTRAGREC